jgi:hypothetical protein
MRYERKYRIEHLDWHEVMATVRQHPASFRMAFPDRRIHNLYLDTPTFQFLQDNLNGVGERMKARIRWYGPDRANLVAPNLEYKLRFNGLGTKTVRALPSPSGDLDAWLAEHLRHEAHLRPVLYNSYERSYLVSFDGRFRLTIDRDLQFNSPAHFLSLPMHRSDAVIVEVKYDAAHDADFGSVGQRLPWTITKNSKYMEGMGLVGNG